MNKKIRRAITKTVSMLIAMVIIGGIYPFSVFADELDDNEVVQPATEYSETEPATEDNTDDPDKESADGTSDDTESPEDVTAAENTDDPTEVPADSGSDNSNTDGNLPDEGTADNVSDNAEPDEELPDEETVPENKKPLAAPPAKGSSLTRLSITRSETDFPSGSSYVMSDTDGKEFLVNYRYADLENVILVIECLDLGADFAALPEKNEFFNEAVKLGQGKMALRLTSAKNRTDCTIGFKMKHVKLTDEQVLRIMDSNKIPASRIAATEYTLPGDAALSDVLTQGTKGEECILWEGSPYFNPDSTVTVTSSSQGYTHTYKVTVSPMSKEDGSYTNLYFDAVCSASFEKMFSGYKSGSPRFAIPGAYNKNGSLMEIVSIRFYEPTGLVRLKGISKPGASSGSSSGDLYDHDFNVNWGNWNIGERTFDPDKNAYFYELTPSSRYFNSNSVGMNELLAGMTLRWTLNNTSEALEPSKSYLAENTVITYRLPGDNQSVRKVEVRGPEILTGELYYLDMRTKFPMKRDANSGKDQDVNVGQKYTNIEFTRLLNGIRDMSGSTHLPVYDSSVTQEYAFPYQIAPSRITIESERTQLISNTEHPVLESISYNTWDNDTWTDADQATIDSYNIKLSANGNCLFSYDFPAGTQVKTVHVKWKRTSIWNYPNHDPAIVTYFDFTPNHCTDNMCKDHLAQGVQVMVKYREYYDKSYRNGEHCPAKTDTATMLLPGQKEPSVQAVEWDLWFRLKCEECEPKKCPELLGNAQDDQLGYFNSGVNGNIGDVGFDIGKKGMTYDLIHDPVITLRFIDAGNATNGGANFQNINNDQMIAFFTGEFTAMPKLSGWVFHYTAENKAHEVYSNSVKIPEIKAEEGIKKCWLPLPEGYAFTSVKLSYDGEFRLRPENEDDTVTRIWLMNDIVVHRNDDIPFLSERVYLPDNRVGYIQLAGSVTFDITELADESGAHCECGKHLSGKDMIYTTVNKKIPTVNVRNNRQTSFNMEFSRPKDAVIYQGEGVGDSSSEYESVTWDASGRAFFAATNGIFIQFPKSYTEMFPYEDITEAVYIELTDEEFIPDLDNSMLWGYKLTDKCIQSEIIVVYDNYKKPHRFLKLQFVEGFIRTRSYEKPKGSSKYEWTDKGIRVVDPESGYLDSGSNVVSLNGHIYRTGFVTGPFSLAFKTVPGTTIGEHHPIGKIYYDFSDIAENYNASVKAPRHTWKGYDNNITLYSLKYDTADVMSITGDRNTMLFSQDGSDWKVTVLLHQETGVSLAPGKNQAYYDFVDHTINFYAGEEKDLNSLITLTGPGEPTASNIYEVTSVTVLPRAGKAITYTESEVSQGTQTDIEKTSDKSSMDLYLRGAPSVAGNNTGIDPVFYYTTAEDPLSDGAVWLSSGSISNWRSVTGIKVTMSSMAPKTSVNIRLDLETDAKNSIDTLTAYAGGRFKYRLTQNGDFIEPQNLELSKWLYNSYEINGFVFWDTYDEDGFLTETKETGIDNVKVTLYDASGNVISQNSEGSLKKTKGGNNSEDGSVLTVDGGTFTLYSNSKDEGQYIVISFPETEDNSKPRLTAVSKDPYMMSPNDSDFDRTNNTLVLGQLDTRSGYNNVSAGFIKLPEITATDIEMYVGDKAYSQADINEFVDNTDHNNDNILINGTYKVVVSGVDESIASVETGDSLFDNTSTTLEYGYIFTGVSAGKFTAEVTLTNRLGDEVKARFNVTVLAEPTEDIVVTSSWDDDNNRDGIRPDGITVQLMRNGVAEGTAVVLNEANNRTYTWPQVDRFDSNGDEIAYTLSVKAIDIVPGHTGYTQEIEKSSFIADLTASSGGYKFTIENKHIPETVERTIVAVWDDEDNIDGIRPENLTADMLNGSSVTLDVAKDWTVTVSGLFKYENGELIDYSWIAPPVPEGYTFSQTVEGTKTTLLYVHRHAQTRAVLPSTGETTAPSVYLAITCFSISSVLFITVVSRSRKKKES